MLPLPIGEALEALFGAPVAQTYAMTESMPIAANPADYTRKLATVGFSAGVDLRLCDDNGEEVARGSEGEVCVRGACVTSGYETRAHQPTDPNPDAFHADAVKPELATRGAWYNPLRAWLRTGDKGLIDADGHLQLVGRFKV